MTLDNTRNVENLRVKIKITNKQGCLIVIYFFLLFFSMHTNLTNKPWKEKENNQ